MTPLHHLSTHPPADLGVLSIHLDDQPCRVGCRFCYLGARERGEGAAPPAPEVVEELLSRLRYREVAVAVSEPVEAVRATLERIVDVATRRGLPVAVTTTPAIAARTEGLLDGVARLNLSIDPDKGEVSLARIDDLCRRLRAREPRLELVLIVTLSTPGFAARLIDQGLLCALIDLPSVDKVALNALKPPPPWCDRAFWLRSCARLASLLARALDSRLFLDCYVAARIFGLGGCPGRPDLSPAPAGVAFRACVYQPAADHLSADAQSLVRRVHDFTPPAVCPFAIP